MSRKFNNGQFVVHELGGFLRLRTLVKNFCTFTFILLSLATLSLLPVKNGNSDTPRFQDKNCAQSEVESNKFRFVKVWQRWQWLVKEKLSWLEEQALRWTSPMAQPTFSMSSQVFTHSGKTLSVKYLKARTCSFLFGKLHNSKVLSREQIAVIEEKNDPELTEFPMFEVRFCHNLFSHLVECQWFFTRSRSGILANFRNSTFKRCSTRWWGPLLVL